MRIRKTKERINTQSMRSCTYEIIGFFCQRIIAFFRFPQLEMEGKSWGEPASSRLEKKEKHSQIHVVRYSQKK